MEAIIIGKELLEIVPIATAISGSVKSIYSLIDTMTSKSNTINTSTYNDIVELLDALDIRTKLDTYSQLVCEFPGTNSQSVKSSLWAVKNVIFEIESKIKSIKYKVDYNKSLWLFPSFRSHSFSKDLKDLEKLVSKLDNRIESLKTVTEISKLWNSQLFKVKESQVNVNKIDISNIDPQYFQYFQK